MGALGGVDSGGEAWRAAAQDRHAFGDERDLLSPANRLPMALFPGGIFPPRSTVYNIFRAFQREGVWERIGRNCARPCANGWGGRRARAPASSTAARSSQPKKGMRERRSRRSGLRRRQEGEGAQDPRSGRHRGLALACGGSLRRDPGSGTAPPWSSIASASASIGLNSSGPMAATTPAKSNASWPPSRRCGWRSSNVPTAVQNSSSCRAGRSLNGPFPGSAETAAWPRTTRTSPTPSRPSSLSPASNSPSGASPGHRLLSCS